MSAIEYPTLTVQIRETDGPHYTFEVLATGNRGTFLACSASLESALTSATYSAARGEWTGMSDAEVTRESATPVVCQNMPSTVTLADLTGPTWSPIESVRSRFNALSVEYGHRLANIDAQCDYCGHWVESIDWTDDADRICDACRADMIERYLPAPTADTCADESHLDHVSAAAEPTDADETDAPLTETDHELQTDRDLRVRADRVRAMPLGARTVVTRTETETETAPALIASYGYGPVIDMPSNARDALDPIMSRYAREWTLIETRAMPADHPDAVSPALRTARERVYTLVCECSYAYVSPVAYGPLRSNPDAHVVLAYDPTAATWSIFQD